MRFVPVKNEQQQDIWGGRGAQHRKPQVLEKCDLTLLDPACRCYVQSRA